MASQATPGGDLEYAVLLALWEGGPSTARSLHESIGEPQGLVYTTVAKVLDRLVAKGLVVRTRVGKAFLFRARQKRANVEGARAREMLVRLAGPRAQLPVAALVEAVEATDPELLDELALAIAARQKGRRDG
jgi:predicted transcriptional regulator